MSFQLLTIAKDYAERACDEQQYPLKLGREQAVSYAMDDFVVGANEYKKFVLSVLKENQEASKTLTDEDKARSAQDILNETYEDLISIFEQ